MDITNPTGILTQIMDLAPTVEECEYEGIAIAAHGSTLRDTYTVPANRRALIQNLTLNLQNETSAAGSGEYHGAEYVVTPDGGAAGIIFRNSFPWYSAQETNFMTRDIPLLMSAGDALTLYSRCSHVCDFNLFAMIIEFDV